MESMAHLDKAILHLQGYICHSGIKRPSPACDRLCFTEIRSSCRPCLTGEYKLGDYPGKCVKCPAGKLINPYFIIELYK